MSFHTVLSTVCNCLLIFDETFFFYPKRIMSITLQARNIVLCLYLWYDIHLKLVLEAQLDGLSLMYTYCTLMFMPFELCCRYIKG